MKRLLALLLAVVLCLSGCSSLGGGSDILAMLSPPKEQADFLGIKEALQNHFSTAMDGKSNIIYLYPNSGEFRSPIVTCDLNRDGNPEAIVFYRMKNISFGLNIAFLTSNEKKEWRVCDIFSKVNIQAVDQVQLLSMESENSTEVVITYKNYYNSRMVEVYGWKYDEITCYLEEKPYTEIGIMDFNYDGFEEMIVVHPLEYNSEMQASMYKLEQKILAVKTSAKWKTDTVTYKQSLVGTVCTPADMEEAQETDHICGMILERYVDNYSVQSEILYLNGGRLIHYRGNDSLRHTATEVPTDLDNDGVLEFPVSTPGDKEAVWFTRWMKLRGEDLQVHLDCVTVHNYQQSYFLMLPEKWAWTYNLRISGDGSQMIFYWMETPEGEILTNGMQEYAIDAKERQLLQIQVLRNKTWEAGKNSLYRQWFVISEREDVTVVAIFLGKEPLSQGSYRVEDLRNAFHNIP